MIQKILFALAIVCASWSVQAQVAEASTAKTAPIKWYSWEEAVALNKTNPKEIYIDLYTDWCGWCKKMDASTFTDSEVAAYMNANFYPVKFNAEQKEAIFYDNKEFKFVAQGSRGVHELAYALVDGKLGYPSFVILDETLARILISPGFKGPKDVMNELLFVNEKHYKTQSWEQYLASKK